jgi:hypothetical protein
MKIDKYTLVPSRGLSFPCVLYVRPFAFLQDVFSLQQRHLCHPPPASEYLDEVCVNNVTIELNTISSTASVKRNRAVGIPKQFSNLQSVGHSLFLIPSSISFRDMANNVNW